MKNYRLRHLSGEWEMRLAMIPLQIEWKLDQIRLAGNVVRRNGFGGQQLFATHALGRLTKTWTPCRLRIPASTGSRARMRPLTSNLGCDNALKDRRILMWRGGTWSSPSNPGSGRIRRRRCAQAELPCWPPVPAVTRFTRNGPSFLKVSSCFINYGHMAPPAVHSWSSRGRQSFRPSPRAR
jgi:hypothetical protein